MSLEDRIWLNPSLSDHDSVASAVDAKSASFDYWTYLVHTECNCLSADLCKEKKSYWKSFSFGPAKALCQLGWCYTCAAFWCLLKLGCSLTCLWLSKMYCLDCKLGDELWSRTFTVDKLTDCGTSLPGLSDAPGWSLEGAHHQRRTLYFLKWMLGIDQRAASELPL